MMNIVFVMSGNEVPTGRSAYQLEMYQLAGNRVTFIIMDMPKDNAPLPTVWFDEADDFPPETISAIDRIIAKANAS